MPELVVCHCDPDWPAVVACEHCLTVQRERDRLEADLRRAGKLAQRSPNHPALAAWRQLIASHAETLERRLDELDEGDRAWEASR